MAINVKGKLAKGSVKILHIKREPTEKEMGLGSFEFTDDYSIFDYGKRPDTIPGKGESLARMAAYNFEQLAKKGISSHYRKFVAPNEIEVNLVRVLYPQKKEISLHTRNYLVPLEIIFRNSLPAGSSVFKRLDKGELKVTDLGLDKYPFPGQVLPKPLIDVSTKLEETDRYLGWREAKELSGLTEPQIEEAKVWARKVNEFITSKAESIGLHHADGKIELAVTPEDKLIVVDVFGTLDEDRMLMDSVHVSKQVLRDYYKALPWYKKLEDARANNDPKEKWPVPPKMSSKLKEIVGNMYKGVCEAWVGKKIWKAPSVQEAVGEYVEFLEKQRI